MAKKMSDGIDSQEQRVMVSFPVGEGGERIVERMYAITCANDHYVLDNSPFYAFGISAGDTFLATQEDGERTFAGIVERGQHSTYRIKLPAGRDHEFFMANWSELEELGCSFEGSSSNLQRLYAIDVPPNVNVFEVYKTLEAKELQGIWEFEEAHYFDPNAE